MCADTITDEEEQKVGGCVRVADAITCKIPY